MGERIANAGYTYSGAAENVFAYTQDPLHGHAGWVIDWGSTDTGIQQPPGHRNNYMNAGMRHIGIRFFFLRTHSPKITS